VFLFRARGAGAFMPRARLVHDYGQRIRRVGGCAVALADWTGDGRLDLLAGGIENGVWLLPNEGLREGLPVFGVARKLELDETEPTPHRDPGPLVVDWDGDGVDDLLVGYGMGNVVFYKGVVEEGVHRVELGQILLQPAYAQEPEELARSELTGALEPVVERSHKLAKPAAFDWNGDGRLDLLVGDSFSAVGPAPALDAQQFVQLQELRKEESEAAQLLGFARRALRGQVEKEFGPREKYRGDWGEWQELTDERMEALVAADPTCQKLGRELGEISARRAAFDAPRVTHGYVWVYLRKGAPEATAAPAR
jgi:hypothetical protein